MEQLKKLRQSRNLSQQKLAEEFHTSQQSIWKYENGISEPDISTLTRLANYFNVSVDYLVGNSDIPERADLIKEKQLSPNESLLIRQFRSMPARTQALILELANALSNDAYTPK